MNKEKTKLQEQIDTLTDFLIFNPDKPIVKVQFIRQDGSGDSSLSLDEIKQVLYKVGACRVKNIIVTVEEQPATSRGYIVYEYTDDRGKKFGSIANFDNNALRVELREAILRRGHEIISVNYTSGEAQVLKEYKFYF